MVHHSAGWRRRTMSVPREHVYQSVTPTLTIVNKDRSWWFEQWLRSKDQRPTYKELYHAYKPFYRPHSWASARIQGVHIFSTINLQRYYFFKKSYLHTLVWSIFHKEAIEEFFNDWNYWGLRVHRHQSCSRLVYLFTRLGRPCNFRGLECLMVSFSRCMTLPWL